MKKLLWISTAAAVLMFAGCSDETKQKAKETAQSAAKDAAKVTQDAKAKAASMMEQAKQEAAAAVEAAKEKAAEAKKSAEQSMQEAKKSASQALEKAKSQAAETETAAKAAAAEAAATVEKEAAEAKKALSAKPSESSAASAVNAQALFAKCAGCHGTDGKSKALGKSPAIAGEDAAELKSKIEGYKAGTRNAYGMGAVMHGQVSGLNDDQIAALAEYISNLK